MAWSFSIFFDTDGQSQPTDITQLLFKRALRRGNYVGGTLAVDRRRLWMIVQVASSCSNTHPIFPNRSHRSRHAPGTNACHRDTPGDKDHDSSAVRKKVEKMGRRQTFHPNRTVSGNHSSARISTVTATPSTACSEASKTSAGSQSDTTDWSETSWLLSVLQLQSATGYESRA